MNAIHPIQQDKPAINGRQLCFFVAFLVPASKLLTLPAKLAYYAKGDLLLPAMLQYLLQGIVLAVILFIASRTDKSFFQMLSDTFGKVTARIVYIFYTLFFLFFSLLPLLELERFVYTAFFDTAPFIFAFTPFFFLSAFICTKNLKAFGRSADIAMPLFLVSFVGLMIISVGQADFSNLMPLLGTPFKSTAKGIYRTFGQFSDTALILPLLGTYRYKKGDGVKVMGSYALGAFFVFLFLAVFYGIFSSLATRQTFAFVKIGQYFQALSVVGRFDLLLTYLMTIVLLFYYCFPLQLAVDCFSKAINTEKRVWISAAINFLLFLFSFLFTKNYNVLYDVITGKLFWIFLLFADLIPVLCLFLNRKPRKDKKQADGEKNADETGGQTAAKKSAKNGALKEEKTKKEKTYA